MYSQTWFQIILTSFQSFLLSFFLNSELGCFAHPCEDDLVLKASNDSVPYFNAPIYLENKEQIGKVDEIFGAIRDYVSLSLRKEREF